MFEVIGHSCCRTAQVDHCSEAFDFVVSSSVEEVAQPNDARRLSGEINRKAGGVATKDSCHGIQFFTAILEVGTGNGEICRACSGDASKQDQILIAPKAVLGRHFRQNWFDDE